MLSEESNCVEKICNLPVDFKTQNKSAHTLVNESGFKDFGHNISVDDVEEYLLGHRDLVDKWQIWSFDKRTGEGYYLSLSEKEYEVGLISSNGKTLEQEKFATPEKACANFIVKEIGSIASI